MPKASKVADAMSGMVVRPQLGHRGLLSEGWASTTHIFSARSCALNLAIRQIGD